MVGTGYTAVGVEVSIGDGVGTTKVGLGPVGDCVGITKVGVGSVGDCVGITIVGKPVGPGSAVAWPGPLLAPPMT